ncbi:MAG: AmmeMemoRadiSam system protein B [Nanoarchaeota archaeon]
MDVRKPYFAGKFYPVDKKTLVNQLKDCFLHELGAQKLPENENFQTVKGLIVPHAGYVFSGMNASCGYFKLKESGVYDLFVIIGFSHSCAEKDFISLSKKNWQTPIGLVKTNQKIADELSNHEFFKIDEDAFIDEHSIEVQLPFLQYLYGDKLNILPISISYKASLDEIKKIATSINKVINKSKLNVCFIASSDFTHYGYHFNYIPFNKDIEKNLLKLDMDAIEFIKTLDTKGFLNYIDETDITICGKNSISLLLEILKYESINRIELLNYYTSAKLTNDHENSVSYASILFESIKL